MTPEDNAVWDLDDETGEVTGLWYYTNWVDDDGY